MKYVNIMNVIHAKMIVCKIRILKCNEKVVQDIVGMGLSNNNVPALQVKHLTILNIIEHIH